MLGTLVLPLKLLSVLIGLLLCSSLLTELTRRYALKRAILDIPNERSSHAIPTPRGGGIAIVITFILSLLWLYAMHLIEKKLLITLMGGGLMIAVLGYYDDLYSIKARTRLCIHILVAAWAVGWLGGLIEIDIGIKQIILHRLGSLFAILGIVWCINFYNFMDGIDGLAGSEGIFVGLSSGCILWFLGSHDVAIQLWVLAFIIAGFTTKNWPPAKIFLGDVGSGFLGFIFAVYALYTANTKLLPITFFGILLGVFLWDATFTLISRCIHRKRIYMAHKEHAYQRLIAYGATHKQVTLGITLLNSLILLPMAVLMLIWPSQSGWLFLTTVFLLWIFWIKINMLRS